MTDPFSPKLFTILKDGITARQVTSEVISGVVVGIIALPLSIAFATASGVAPSQGIITAIIAGFLISALGGSRVQIGGPTGAFVVMIFSIVQRYGMDGLFWSTIMAGIFLVIFGLLRFGTFLKYIPYSLVVGFTSGIAVIIFFTQVKDALGLEIAQVPADFLEKLSSYGDHIGTIQPSALLITLETIGIIFLLKRFSERIPGALIALILMSVQTLLFKLPVETIGTLYGTIPTSIEFYLPSHMPSDLLQLIGPALSIALLGGIESLLSASVADGMISGHHRSNTELIAQGIANVATPFFTGIPATGAIARTAANIKNGGRTPISGIVHSLTLLAVMLFLGRFVVHIPMASLAGILIVVAYNMSEYTSFLSVLRGNGHDRLILLTTFLLTIFFDLVIAIQVGVVLSSFLFMKRMSDIAEKRIEPVIDTDLIENYESLPDHVSVFEISGPLFFASAHRYSELIRERGEKGSILIIRFRHVDFIDRTGMNHLFDTLTYLKRRKITVILTGMNTEVREKLEHHDLYSLCDRQNVVNLFSEAAERFLQR